MAKQNFIGGTWRDAKSGATDEVVNPATGEVLDEVRVERRGRRRRRGRRGRGAPSTSGRATTPRQRARLLHKVADAIEADLDTIQTLESTTSASPSRSSSSRWTSPSTTGASSPRARASSRTRGRGRVHGGPHVVPAPRPARRRRVDRAVELPAQHGDVEGRARARRGQHRRAQAVGAHAAHARCASPRSPPTSSRPACSTS